MFPGAPLTESISDRIGRSATSLRPGEGGQSPLTPVASSKYASAWDEVHCVSRLVVNLSTQEVVELPMHVQVRQGEVRQPIGGPHSNEVYIRSGRETK